AAQPAFPHIEAPREREDRSHGGGSRRRSEDARPRRGATGERAEGGGGGGGFSLGEAYGLLKQALSRLGGGEKPVSADQLRDTMVELKGAEAEPLDPERFPKLLQQAQDAEIIHLSLEGDGAYAVKLREEAPGAPAPEPVGAPDLDEANDP